MLFFYKYIQAYCAAKKDASGEYGKHYIKTREEKQIIISEFMQKLAKEYDCKCKRKQRHSSSVRKIYFQIISKDQNLKKTIINIEEQLSQLQNQSSAINKNIANIETHLKIQCNNWNEINCTGILKPNMEAKNMGDLYNHIKENQEILVALKKDKNQKDNEIEYKKIEKNNITDGICLELRDLFFSYQEEIDYIWSYMECLEIQYDKILRFYWYTYIRKIGKANKTTNSLYRQSPSFFEICQLCNVNWINRESIFPSESEVINQKSTNFV